MTNFIKRFFETLVLLFQMWALSLEKRNLRFHIAVQKKMLDMNNQDLERVSWKAGYLTALLDLRAKVFPERGGEIDPFIEGRFSAMMPRKRKAET